MSLLADRKTNHWGYYYVSMTCGECAVVLAEDPNGVQGRNRNDEGAEDYWLGNGARTNQTYEYDDRECTAAPTLPPLSGAYVLTRRG